ncbi:MAG: hypothetical protein LBU32_16540, partial [Clostridiales bacterium]|nr:hypothetical protein [Clostridiales bacterium]
MSMRKNQAGNIDINGIISEIDAKYHVMHDIIFKEVMGEKNTLRFVQSLGVEIEHFTVFHNEHVIPPHSLGGRGIRCDAYGEANGSIADVEGQRYYYTDHCDRALTYFSTIRSFSMKPGTNFSQIPYIAVIFVNWTNDAAIGLVDCIALQHEPSGLNYNEKLKIVDVNLEKIRELDDTYKEDFKVFLNFFCLGYNEELFRLSIEDMHSNSSKQLAESLIEDMNIIKGNPHVQADLEEYLSQNNGSIIVGEDRLPVATIAALVERTRDEGIQQGRLEGKLEGKLEGRLEGKLEGRLEGKLEGRLEGKLEGKLEGRLEDVLRAFRRGKSVAEINEVTDINVPVLERI